MGAVLYSAEGPGIPQVDPGLETTLNEMVSSQFVIAELSDSLVLHARSSHELSHGRLAQFYILSSGLCELVCPQSQLACLVQAGDLLLVFACVGLGQGARLRARALAQGSPDKAHLLRGGFDLAGSRGWPLSRLVPTLLHLKVSEHAWLRPIGGALSELARLGTIGRHALSRLMEGVLIQALLSGLPGALRQGNGKALTDRAVGEALKRMHRAPEENWSVERLADEVGASRSAFARRFTDAIGDSPMRYLAQVRLELAEQILRNQPCITLAQLAVRVGYANEFSLSKAFRRHFGHAPRAHTLAHNKSGPASS